MISRHLALINEFLGQPPNASEHGFQIDHIIEFSHWFMRSAIVNLDVECRSVDGRG